MQNFYFTAIYFQKRLFLDTRHYYHTKLGGPLSIVLALPDKYGLNTVRHKPVDDFMVILRDTLGNIMESQFWKIHPEWSVFIYIKSIFN